MSRSPVGSIALAGLLLAGCGSATGGDSIEGPATAVTLTEEASRQPEGLPTLVDFRVTDAGDDICYEIVWNDGIDAPTSGCLDVEPPVIPLINEVLDVNVSGEDLSEFVSLFVLMDPGITVIDVAQNGLEAEWLQVGRGLAIQGESFLGSTTEVTYELDGVVGTCVWSPDGGVCGIRS